MDRTTKGNSYQTNHPPSLIRWTQDQQLSGQATRERAQKPQGRGKSECMYRVHQLVEVDSLKASS
jgi:hypothetical protein